MNKEDIKELIKEKKISYIRLQFTDTLGDIKAVEIPVSKIDDAFRLGITLRNEVILCWL